MKMLLELKPEYSTLANCIIFSSFHPYADLIVIPAPWNSIVQLHCTSFIVLQPLLFSSPSNENCFFFWPLVFWMFACDVIKFHSVMQQEFMLPAKFYTLIMEYPKAKFYTETIRKPPKMFCVAVFGGQRAQNRCFMWIWIASWEGCSGSGNQPVLTVRWSHKRRRYLLPVNVWSAEGCWHVVPLHSLST